MQSINFLQPQRCVLFGSPQNVVNLRKKTTFFRRQSFEQSQDGFDNIQGDRQLQEALATVLQIEVTKARAKDQLDTAVDGEKNKMIEAAEQAKQEIDRIANSSDARSESAFNAAMDNVNSDFEEYYKELQNSRKQMEEDEADFEEFQKQMVEERSRGQFFKQLYQSDLPQKKDKSYSTMDVSQSNRKKLQKLKMYRKTYDVSKSPVRLGLFSFLTLILGAQVCLDLGSDSVSLGIDGLYSMLAVIFGAYAWKERYYILKARQNK
eukprot:TRINITY_DN44721_c0_g1_i1.p2 TRINITY_DN44721_c0_g1~~TRINITY_DN44721_c0_g1_i1.p2  ORF type:complete len:281 (-),score=36.47 TRINITY_DN44721_c0_g1_i1:704-1495(-)